MLSLRAFATTMDVIRDAVHDAAQRSVSQGAIAATLFGIVFHLLIRPFEFELIMFHFMAASTLTFFGMFYTFGFVKALAFASSFSIGLLGSIALYRLAFHRCRNFPGPTAAKISKFYAARLSAKNVQYYKELEKMHGQYGDFVRTGERLSTQDSIRVDSDEQQRSPRDQRSTQVGCSNSLWSQFGMFEINMVWPDRQRPEEVFDTHDA